MPSLGPPRRVSGLVRYILLTVFFVVLIYHFGPTLGPASHRDSHAPDNSYGDYGVYENYEEPEVFEAVGTKSASATPTSRVDVDGELLADDEQELEELLAEPTPTNIIKQKTVHPIDILIEDGDRVYDDFMKKESHNLQQAAAAYRKRRGRHPPPGFDVWYRNAADNNALIIEDFFDQIYHDLGPFWGLPPSIMRKESWDYDMTITVRDGVANITSDWFWTKIWHNLTQSIETMLPDMDIPLNSMDEPRIVVPWEQIDEYMEMERASRSMAPPNEVITAFQVLPPPGESDQEVETRAKDWENTYPFWSIASRGCHPDSLARQAEHITDFSTPPTISMAHARAHTYKGYVSNYSLSTDFCHQPDLQALHGIMIRPISVLSTKTLFPLFGGSKLITNNEILLPAPMYWNEEERFTGGDDHGVPWIEKQNKAIWRGVATGGENKADNWRGFQRHRFVAMTNSTQVSAVEAWAATPQNWAMPFSQLDLHAQQDNRLGEWVGLWADTGFTELMCFKLVNDTCPYVDPYFSKREGVKMSDQFDCKYLPDIDGNSFSGRYLGFLRSTSLPIKATIFKEWHDSRLIPWRHFVPMDNRFMEFYSIMQYFLGYQDINGNMILESHDEEAARIAAEGQAWADRVLRKEDMQIYTHRVLLEYARLLDDERDVLGYVADLDRDTQVHPQNVGDRKPA